MFTIGDAAPYHSLYGVCCSDVECYFILFLILLSMSYFIMVIACLSDMRIYMAIYFGSTIRFYYCLYLGMSVHSDLLLEYWIEHVNIGLLYARFIFSTYKVFYRGVPGFGTYCPWGVWCRRWTTSLLPVGPFFGNYILTTVVSCDQAALQTVFSVRPSVCLSVTPFLLCSNQRIIMKFSGVIISDKSDVHAKGQGQRSNVKVTEVTTPLCRFRTVTPVWIHVWWWNNAYSLIMLRRGALLFFKVICQISRSHGSKNHRIWPRLGVSGL